MFEKVATLVRSVGRRLSPEDSRVWSNRLLHHVGAMMEGDVVNVSGWRDEDKHGRRYRDYFPKAKTYTVTNYASPRRGLGDGVPSIELDLTAPLPDRLRNAFDVVFNHTTLEHIFDLTTAAANLAAMTRDIVVVVVPFTEAIHGHEDGFGDFWRFTPEAVDGLFRPHDVVRVYAAMNHQPWWGIYVFWVGSRRPDRWRKQLETTSDRLPAPCR
jgi:hypothetical protein